MGRLIAPTPISHKSGRWNAALDPRLMRGKGTRAASDLSHITDGSIGQGTVRRIGTFSPHAAGGRLCLSLGSTLPAGILSPNFRRAPYSPRLRHFDISY